MRAMAVLCIVSLWAFSARANDSASKDATVKGDVMKIPLPKEPTDAKTAIDSGKKAIEAATSGKWWYFSAIMIMMAMFSLKVLRVLERIGRWKYVIVPSLSLIAALLAAFEGGVSIENAIGVFTTGWSTGMLEELINHGIMGKPHS